MSTPDIRVPKAEAMIISTRRTMASCTEEKIFKSLYFGLFTFVYIVVSLHILSSSSIRIKLFLLLTNSYKKSLTILYKIVE